MIGFLQKVLSRREPAEAPTTRPRLEALEGRETPAVGLNPFNGQLAIFQTDFNDRASVQQDVFGNIIVDDNGFLSAFSPFQVQTIFYYGAAGNDFFANNTFLTSTQFGGFGADVLVGGLGTDFLIGNDLFVPGGDGAPDVLWGSFGADVFASEPIFDSFGNPIIDPFTLQALNREFTPDLNPFAGDLLF